ncbi:hypothetical protein EJB05_01341, partial [Eragrostis curvula]
MPWGLRKLGPEGDVGMGQDVSMPQDTGTSLSPLERQNALLSHEKSILEKKLEEATKKAQEFSSQKKDVERSLQEYKDAAEVLQAELEEQIKAKVDELKVLGTKKEEVDARAASLESELHAVMAAKGELEADVVAKNREYEVVKGEIDELRSKVLMVEEKYSMSKEEVKRLKMELDTLTEAKEADAKAFDDEKAKIVKELEDLKKKLEKIQASKDLVEGENDKLRSEVLSAEQKYSMSEDEVKRLKMELSALEEANEAAIRAFDAQKAEIMKESYDFKRKLEEIQAKKDLLEGENNKLHSDVLMAEQKNSMHEEETQMIKIELDALVEAKEAAAMTFDAEKAKIMKELDEHKRKVEKMEANLDLMKEGNDKLRLELSTTEQKCSLSETEAKMLQIELSALAEANEAIVKAFYGKKAEMTKELENLNKILKETQTHKDLLKGENEKLRSDVLTIERNYIQSEAEVKRLQMEFSVLADVKEANAKEFDAEKVKIMKELENLRSKVGEIQASKEAAEEIGRDKDAQAEKIRADLEDLHISMSQLKASYDELEAKHLHLKHEKDSVQKELDAEKAEAMNLKSKIEVLESYNKEKVEELKDTRMAGLFFMNTADEYQDIVEKEFKEKMEELKDTRTAALLFMNAADEYQEVVESEYKAKVEELKDTRMAGLLIMNAADEYQEVVEKEFKVKSKEFEVLQAQKVEMDVRATSLESKLPETMAEKEKLEVDAMVKKREYDVVKEANDKPPLDALTLHSSAQ